MKKNEQLQNTKHDKEDFEKVLINNSVILDDLIRHEFKILGVVNRNSKLEGLHVFEKGNNYYYFRFNPDHLSEDDEYKLVHKSEHKVGTTMKGYDK